MGPPPPPPPPPSSPPPPPNLLSSADDDWFLHVSDRDTQILTQALTRELSSCRPGPSSSSLFPSPATSSVYETLSRCLGEAPLQDQSINVLRALHQQQQHQRRQQLQHNHLQQQQQLLLQQKAVAMAPSMQPYGDRFTLLEQNSLQKGSPVSSNSSPPLSASAETPASPFSTLSTSSAISNMATESFLAHSNPNNPQHLDSHDGQLARTIAPSSKPPDVSSMCSDSSLSSKAAFIALSSQASVGAGSSKVNKRRSRSSSKAPIAVLSADTSNFRAMVQQLTGIPSSSSFQSFAHSGLPLLKPQPIRHTFANTLNLPTLDTSACFLGPKNLNKGGFSFAQKQHQMSSSSAANNFDPSRVQGCNSENSATQRHMPSLVKESVFSTPANAINHSLSSSLSDLWDSADCWKARGSFSSLLEGEQIAARQTPIATPAAAFDTLLMEEHLAAKSSFNAVDSWFSLDGVHAIHSPNTEIARMA